MQGYGRQSMADAMVNPGMPSRSANEALPPSQQTILNMLSELTDQSVQLGMMAGEVVNALTPPGPEDGKCSPPLPKPGCVVEYLDLIRVQMNVADMYLRQALQAIGGGIHTENTKRG